MSAFDPWLADAFDAARELHTPDTITGLVDMLGGAGRGGGVAKLAKALLDAGAFPKAGGISIKPDAGQRGAERNVQRYLAYERGERGSGPRKPPEKIIKQARGVLPVRAKALRDVIDLNRPNDLNLVIHGSIRVSNDPKGRKRPVIKSYMNADDLAAFWGKILPEDAQKDTTALLDVAYGRIPDAVGEEFENAVIRGYCGQDGEFTEIESVEGLVFE